MAAEKKNYVFKVQIKEDGSLSASYSENGRANEDINLVKGSDKLSLEDRYETIDIIVNILRDNRLKGDDEYKMLGEYLYKALLNNKIGEKIHELKKNNDVEYIKVELKFIGESNSYSSWPWEYMYYKPEDIFIATHPKIIVTRPVDEELKNTEMPLRILLVAPGPASTIKGDIKKIQSQFGLSLLAYKSLFEEIQRICSDVPSKISIEILEATERQNEMSDDANDKVFALTIKDFADKVKALQPHVIHFYGHGKLDEKNIKGQLAFTEAWGKRAWIDEDVFANKVKESQHIKFVFLQACESALSAPHKAISGVAQKLVLRSVPAVIAMQCRINQDSAISFTKSFYQELASTGIIDAAVQKGRLCIYEEKRALADSDEKERDFAFGIPVLYIKNRVGLFKQEEERRDLKPTQDLPGKPIALGVEEFICIGCNQPKPTTYKFCMCNFKLGKYVDNPNKHNCKNVNCPSRVFESHLCCVECGVSIASEPKPNNNEHVIGV